MTSAAGKIQAAIYAGYGVAGTVLGQPFDLYRPAAARAPFSAPKLTTLPAQFTNAKASGFNFDKSATYEDMLFAGLFDASQTQVGDYLVGALTYFIAAMPPLLNVVCVQCNRVVSLERPNSEIGPQNGPQSGGALPSQVNGVGRYFGQSNQVVSTAYDAGMEQIVADVPVCILGTTGRATGTGELPADAPGPSRWRVSMPPSVFPEGSVRDRDILVDEDGYRYQISAAVWTALGYRVETVRLES